MKAIWIFAASIMFAYSANAVESAPKICGSVLKCGEYSGVATETLSDGTVKKLDETLSLKEIDDTTIELKVTDANQQSSKSRTWKYIMKFKSDGAFTLLETAAGHAGEFAADGVCEQFQCNYRFKPSVVMTTGSFAFDGDFISLTVHELFVDGAYFTRGSKLARK